MTKLRTNILNPVTPDRAEFLTDQVLGIADGKIALLRPYDQALDRDAEDHVDCVALPGLIDLHVHLSQYRARGRYEPALLPWLSNHIFPAEALSSNPEYAAALADDFFAGLFKAGTTTAVIYTAPFREACEAAFNAADRLGARALIGMTLMDAHSPAPLLQTTAYAYENSVALYERWNAVNPLLGYVFTPRFAPTCSVELMKLIGSFASSRSAYIQSHLSENKDEIAWVKELFGGPSYTHVYAEMGILGLRTVMGHAIHLSDAEFDILKATNTAVAHCPDSNFFLKSGEFPYQRMWDKGIRVGLGSDVGAGTTLNMLHHAQMANFRQSTYALTPERLLWHLTMSPARILGWEDRIGSIQHGKDADLCLLRMNPDNISGENLLSSLCFYGREHKIAKTLIKGRAVYTAE